MSRSRRAGKANARVLRNLQDLEACASTSRALNLLAVSRRYTGDLEYQARPFFQNPILNRCFIVKHRFRPDERDLAPTGGASGTKIILPIDPTDLAAGAHSFFIHQRGTTSFSRNSRRTAGFARPTARCWICWTPCRRWTPS